jgi:hypothetical protein
MHTLLLRAGWQVVSGDGKAVIASRRSSFSEAVQTDDVSAMVLAQSEALARLSREITQAITAVPAGGAPSH